MSPNTRSLPTAALLLGVLASFSGCLTYSDVLGDAHNAAEGGDWPAAEQRLNALLGVDSRDEVPEPLDSNKTLVILERAIVLQAQGAFEDSLRDLAAAEEGLEAIDFEHDAGGKVSTYLYSASKANYAAPPVERMALNSFNMLNYLALGRTQDASIEARRYQVMRDFLETQEDPPRGRLGAYLAGFIFEHMGEPERAIRYYEEVLEKGPMASLDDALARVATRTRWRGPAVTSALERAASPSTRDVPAARAPGADGARAAQRPPNANTSSEILVVTSLGRTPRKVALRIPIGAAVGIAGTFITGDLDILERSVFKVLVFPELEAVPSAVTGARIVVDGEAIGSDLVESFGTEVVEDYEKVKPALIGQALSRLIARAALAEGARIGGREAGGGSQALGRILALATEATLTGLDKPDTRSWSFLPDKVLVARVPVAPGSHEVEIQLTGSGDSYRRNVDVKASSFAAVVITQPR